MALPNDPSINERHKARMVRKKDVVEVKIEQAQRDQGVVVVRPCSTW